MIMLEKKLLFIKCSEKLGHVRSGGALGIYVEWEKTQKQ